MASNYIPIFEIYKGSDNVTARFQDRAVSITVRLASGGGEQDYVEILLDDRDWAVATPQIGDRLDISLGYADVGVAFMGSFEVNKIRYHFPPKQISVIGTAATSLSEIKSNKTISFQDKTVEQLLAEYGSKIGMKVDVHGSIADKKITHLDNDNLSFQALVAKLEKQYNAIAKFQNGRVTLMPRDGSRSVSDFATQVYVFRPEHLADAEVYVDSAPAYAKVKANWREKKDHQWQQVEASTKARNNQSTADHTITKWFPTKEEAQAAADSTMAQLDRATGKIGATLASGDPWLRDGQRVLVTDARDGIDGSYLVDLVEHRYSKDQGLRTTFSGSAGDAGLPEAFQSGSTAEGFVTLSPSQFVFGQALRDPGLVLDQRNTSIPSLIGSPPPIP